MDGPNDMRGASLVSGIARLPMARLPMASLPMAHLPMARLPMACLPMARLPIKTLLITSWWRYTVSECLLVINIIPRLHSLIAV